MIDQKKCKTSRDTVAAPEPIIENNFLDTPGAGSSGTSMLRLSEIKSPRQKWKVLGSREAIQLLNPSSTPRTGTPGGLRLNSRPDLNRNDSLLIPGSRDKLNSGSDHDDKHGSRPSSARSGRSALSSLNLSGVQNSSANQNSEPKEEKSSAKSGASLSTNSDYKSAIPYLPQWLAVILLMLNALIPGFGTMLSGFAIFCCGKPRIYSKEGHKMRTLCANLTVGTMQFFTVPFMLVGWFWSLVWGIYMVILSVEYQRSEKAKREKEIQAKALTALNANLRPWTLMRS